jgi:ureidoglycolate hydrolase
VSEIRVVSVPLRHLDSTRFAPYGVVVEAGLPDSKNLNRAPGQMAFMWVHRMLEYSKQPFLATCRYYYRGSRCEFLQRHPSSNVVLVPLGCHPSVILLAPDASGVPDVERAEGFLLDGSKGVVIEPNTWIRYAYPLTEFADFAYVSARLDPADDIEHVYLDRDLGVVLEFQMRPPEGPGVEYSLGGAVTALPLTVVARIETADDVARQA